MESDVRWQGKYYRVVEGILEMETMEDTPIFYIEKRSRFLFWTWWETNTYEYYTTQWDSEFKLEDAIKRAKELDHKKLFSYT